MASFDDLMDTAPTPQYTELTAAQIKHFQDAVQSLEGYELARASLAPYQGWMYFKKVGSREYLFHAVDRHNNGKSLGARSPEAEARLARWHTEKEAALRAFETATQSFEEQRRLTKAMRLGRFPKEAAKLMRYLERAGVADRFAVIGTHALYAYESMADVRFVSNLTATKDCDLLWDSRQKIVFMEIDGEPVEGLMALLKKVDKTFTKNSERSFQAVNANGFAVEILRPEEPREPLLIAENDGINPIHLKGLEYLLSAPWTTEVVISDDHYPLKLRVPDPAVFALHKLWVADQPDRRPGKARRDREQARAVARLIRERLPQYAFDIDRVQNFAPELLEYLDTLDSD